MWAMMEKFLITDGGDEPGATRFAARSCVRDRLEDGLLRACLLPQFRSTRTAPKAALPAKRRLHFGCELEEDGLGPGNDCGKVMQLAVGSTGCRLGIPASIVHGRPIASNICAQKPSPQQALLSALLVELK
mmetsp:Transcript_19370/g.43572  ORF Transcript_19370/g.43572 Transcript_19370/m.43572 type:complete len:131 (-) Transcript_19370:3-395(-)